MRTAVVILGPSTVENTMNGPVFQRTVRHCELYIVLPSRTGNNADDTVCYRCFRVPRELRPTT